MDISGATRVTVAKVSLHYTSPYTAGVRYIQYLHSTD